MAEIGDNFEIVCKYCQKDTYMVYTKKKKWKVRDWRRVAKDWIVHDCPQRTAHFVKTSPGMQRAVRSKAELNAQMDKAIQRDS